MWVIRVKQEQLPRMPKEWPWHHDIACMDAGTYYLSGTKIMTIRPEHRRSIPSMAPRHTVHPEHKNELK